MNGISYTDHAERKFELLKRHGVILSKSMVERTVKHPEEVVASLKNRKVAQAGLDSRHLLRVIYEERDGNIVIITFYPARRERYEG